MIKSFILKEPMVLFLFLGLLIFSYDSLTTNPYESEKALVISQGNIRHLTAGFEKTWQRPPTREELERLVDERIREEVFYREAMALRLDDEDTIVRRRLRQKYEFLVEDLGNYSDPADDELDSYMNAHPDEFRLEAKLTFQQIYLDPSKPRNTPAYIQSLKEQLQDGSIENSRLSELGDSFMLAFSHPATGARVVDSNFGSGFSDRLMALPIGSWQGPIESGYGLHLVHLKRYIPARTPSLDEVRGRVVLEWQRAKKQAFLQNHYETLLKKYEIVIEDDYLDQEEDV
jgi:hypothetical protein